MTNQPADETIVVRYVLEAQDTIAKAKEVDAQILENKSRFDIYVCFFWCINQEFGYRNATGS